MKEKNVIAFLAIFVIISSFVLVSAENAPEQYCSKDTPMECYPTCTDCPPEEQYIYCMQCKSYFIQEFSPIEGQLHFNVKYLGIVYLFFNDIEIAQANIHYQSNSLETQTMIEKVFFSPKVSQLESWECFVKYLKGEVQFFRGTIC